MCMLEEDNSLARECSRSRLYNVTRRFANDGVRGFASTSEVIAKLGVDVYIDDTIRYRDVDKITDLVDPTSLLVKRQSGTYKCSACHTEFPTSTYECANEALRGPRELMYCPECGARFIRDTLTGLEDENEDSDTNPEISCDTVRE